jgi:hypothetical protein
MRRGLLSLSLAVALAVWACAASAQVLVTPHVQDVDLRKLPSSPVWVADSPVREVPDLKRTNVAGQPAVTLGPYTMRLVERSVLVLGADGGRLAGPLPFGSFWPPATEPCGVDVEWPPAINVDRQAARWLISRRFQPMPDGTVPFCVAVSRTDDPLAGGWWLFAFSLPASQYEAHQFEISTDTYRLTGKPGERTVQITFDRAAMLAGKPAGFTVSTR